MKVLLLVLSVLAVASCDDQWQISNSEANAVADVETKFHSVPQNHHRNKRKIIDVAFFPARKWPTLIEYYMDPSLSDEEQRLLETVIEDDFEANTCLRFKELNNTIHAEHQFMWFQTNDDIGICKAYIGRNNDTKTFNGQPLYLGSRCFNYRGTLVHMIAATLGMYNEVQRPDRDDNIEIEWDNIKTEGKEFFVKQSDDVIHYHGTPYDFASAVHYSSDAWLKDSLRENHSVPKIEDTNSYTVRPKDPRLFRLLGQKSELSSYDIEVINKAYCAEQCGDITVSCSNGGYQDPNHCAKCKCPDGFSGDLCDGYAENVGGPGHQCMPVSDRVSVTETEQCVSSPGYEQGKSFTTGDQCTWVLDAPAGRTIDMWFQEAIFGLAYVNTAYSFCVHWVEIKYKGLDSPRGPRFCSLDALLHTLPTKFSPLSSHSNQVMVIFKSPQAHLYSEYPDSARRGFKLCFKHREASSTTPPATSVSSTSSSTSSPSSSTSSPSSNTVTSSSSSTTHDKAVANPVVKTETPGHATKDNTPLIVGVIAALIVLLIIFGIIIVVLLYKRKRKQVPPIVNSPACVMENPGYAQAAPVVTYHNPDSDKKMAVLDAFGVSMGDLPPKYDDIPPEDNVPRYTYAYNASPVSSEPTEPSPDYENAGNVNKGSLGDESGEPVYQNTRNVSIKNLRSKFEN